MRGHNEREAQRRVQEIKKRVRKIQTYKDRWQLDDSLPNNCSLS